MALIECKECGGPISSAAKACPKCGAAPPKRVGILGWLSVLFVAYIAYKLMAPSDPPTPPPSAAEIERKARDEAVFRKVALAAATIKKNLREPDSVTWETILADSEANVMCFSYRARNGFGGMALEHISVAEGKFSRKTQDWNRHCAGKMLNDMIHVRQALR